MMFDQFPFLFILGTGWIFFVVAMIMAVIYRAKLKIVTESRKEMADHFKVMSADALDASHETFLKIAQERFKLWEQTNKGDLEKRQTAIHDMIAPVQKQLEILGGAVEQLKGTDHLIREDLKALSQNTLKLAGAMNNPAMRGRWGEMLLDRLLEKAGMVRGVHYNTQTSLVGDGGTRLRPDVIISLQDGFRIAIDAKTPIQDILDDMDNPGEQEKIRTRLAVQVRKHIQDLGSKSYHEALGGDIDFTVLFLPGEHLFSLALSGDPDLIDHAADHNIILASPSLMMSLLRVVHLSWRQGELAENAQKIAATGRDLYKSLSVFAGHMDKVGTNLGRSVSAYNEALGSLERNVTSKARKFEDLQAVHGSEILLSPKSIDIQPREITQRIG